MVGIRRIGAYVPLFRLDRKSTIGGRGEKAICNFDEDSLTMAVEAVNDCLRNKDRNSIDALYFGTTTSLYKEHLDSTTIAMASDMRENIQTSDFGNSLRAGTAALKAGIDSVKAGSTKETVVCASDCRLGAPGSLLERNVGDGAAALLISDTDPAVILEESEHVYNEIIDIWRNNEQTFVKSWENRFAIEQGYLPSMYKAIQGLMKKMNYKPSDFSKVVLYSPDARRSGQLAKMLGFDNQEQIHDPLINTMGDTGAASALMLFISALEESAPGDRILLASYGNGADAFSFQVTDNIHEMKRKQHLGMKGHLNSKRTIEDYMKYLRWKEILPMEGITGPNATYSAVAAKREYDRTISLHGSKCKSCGYVQYPPQRVCTNCQTKDNMNLFSFLNQQGEIFTFTMDYITPRTEMPTVTTEVDFKCGGRIQCYMTEVDTEQLTVGLPVEMSFRRFTPWEQIPKREGVYTYFWESKPIRSKL